MRPIEKLMYIVSLAYPLTAVPQIIKVYSTHDVESLALLSWVLYIIFGAIFVVYAISEKLKPLIIEGSLWVGIYVLMAGAIIVYA